MRTQSKGESSIWSSELVAGMLAFLRVKLNRTSGGMETGKRACPPTSPARPRRPVTGMTSQRGIRPKSAAPAGRICSTNSVSESVPLPGGCVARNERPGSGVRAARRQ